MSHPLNPEDYDNLPTLFVAWEPAFEPTPETTRSEKDDTPAATTNYAPTANDNYNCHDNGNCNGDKDDN